MFLFILFKTFLTYFSGLNIDLIDYSAAGKIFAVAFLLWTVVMMHNRTLKKRPC